MAQDFEYQNWFLLLLAERVLATLCPVEIEGLYSAFLVRFGLTGHLGTVFVKLPNYPASLEIHTETVKLLPEI